ncbi:MAG: CHAT domain-containing protein [Sulfuritalea sp.]|nr:CHAT domain-containing protein [Sulfuritalea sp.]
MAEYEANPGQGKAEALRKAMLALIATPKHPEYAHPIFWAPFVVVGEGGTNSGTAPSVPVLISHPSLPLGYQCRVRKKPFRSTVPTDPTHQSLAV